MRLTDFLSARSLTDSAFASMIDVHHTTVGRWKRGDTRPDWDVLQRIVEVTDGQVTPNDFIDVASAAAPETAQ